MNNNNFKTWIEKQNIIILDGALSTPLEKLGEDLNNKLWTAKTILNNPEKIIKVHTDYFNCGANIATTSSYQVSFQGFKDFGYNEEDTELVLRKTVQLAKLGRENSSSSQEKFIAASIGPYGAYLADGSEYRGDYTISDEQLYLFHKKRLDILIDEGVDILAFETIPNINEIKVLLNILSEYPDQLAWLSCTLRDERHISDGSDLKIVQKLLENNSQIVTYGFNCVSPKLINPAINYLKDDAKKNFIVYPNGGASYDAVTKKWSQDSNCDNIFNEQVITWHKNGCKWLGGCCCTLKEDIATLTRTFNN